MVTSLKYGGQKLGDSAINFLFREALTLPVIRRSKLELNKGVSGQCQGTAKRQTAKSRSLVALHQNLQLFAR
jgi:hypothetical protein